MYTHRVKTMWYLIIEQTCGSLQELCPAPPSGVVCHSLSDSLSSYKEYPAHRPFINTLLLHHLPQRNTHHTPRMSSPSKAFPETSSEGKCVCTAHVCVSPTHFLCRYCVVFDLRDHSMCYLTPQYLNGSATVTSTRNPFTVSLFLSSEAIPISPHIYSIHTFYFYDSKYCIL